MPRRLLTVVDSFAIRGRGLIVAPWLAESEARRERFAVELRRPDGSHARCEAFAQIPFLSLPALVLQVHLALFGVTKDDVPIGTEVWTLE
jgi:hypothetical protein